MPMEKYRLTVIFTITALVVITAAALVVTRVVGHLTEENLVRIAEENTARDALHIQAMMRRQDHDVADSVGTLQNAEHPRPLTLEGVTGPSGLPTTYPHLVEGLNMVKLNVFDLNGTTVWSSDPAAIGVTKRESPLFAKAAAGGISSKLKRDHDVVHLDGAVRRVDVVETYLPLRETPGGKIVGAMEVYRDIDDVIVQVGDTKSMVMWTTIGAMAGLFLFLVGFIVVADVNIGRSRRRELAVVEAANETLEDRVLARTRELERAQEQLVRSEKLAAIGQLAGSVAHDLRNPLGAINNAVYYLRRVMGGSDLAQSNPRVPQFLGLVEQEVSHSNKIISDLMQFARVGTPSFSPTDIGQVVDHTISAIDAREEISVVKEFAQDLPRVPADPEQLQRVFTNLVLNAQDAMPDGGEIILRAGSEDGYLKVDVIDTGVGMSDEQIGKVFEPLFTTKPAGTGLGLSICHQIVSQHGGRIDVDSREGDGSTFTVYLPVNSASAHRDGEGVGG